MDLRPATRLQQLRSLAQFWEGAQDEVWVAAAAARCSQVDGRASSPVSGSPRFRSLYKLSSVVYVTKACQISCLGNKGLLEEHDAALPAEGG